MSWTVIKDLKEKRAKAYADANAIRATAHKENRDLTDDESKRNDALLSEVESYNKRISTEERSAALGELIGASKSEVGREVSSNSIGMPEKDFKRYSINRAIRCRMNNQPLDGVEAEVSAEIASRSDRKPQGFYVPWEHSRAFDTTAGTGSVGVKVTSDLIELLRNKVVMNSLGATILTGMQGKFALPRQTGAGTAYWLAESGAPTASNQTVDQVAFTPKTLGAFTDISRQLVNQTSLDAEAFVRDDLSQVMALALDLAAISGTGASNQPTGIVNASGIGSVSHGTNGGAETWAKVVEYEKDVLAANVNPNGKLGYLSNSKVLAALKTTDKTSGGYGQFIYDSTGKVNGYNIAVTNAVASNGTKGTGTSLSTMIFGDFSQLVIAFWGGLDLLVDPYTGSSSGTVRLVALQDCDIEIRHAAAFAVATDIIA